MKQTMKSQLFPGPVSMAAHVRCWQSGRFNRSGWCPCQALASVSGNTDPPVHASSVQVPAEAAAAYIVQRGSFELRVAKGELSYVPPLVMTIVTQYPDIQFEYTGGFHYIPPREDSSGTNMNVSI
mgnify:CR=1 FL=1